jgi:uncharacterized protein YjiS (DUF1127 family)
METTKPKRGRPRKANPLTPAQRHARWRQKRKQEVNELLKIYHEANANDNS